MDFKGAPKKRTTNFREDETKLLIQLWGSPTVQNRLYLTHRKAPVMRLIAANMEKHGFYRTPEEIKTRIRNLKCLYHKILKTKDNKGASVGTDDLDWPHFKAMDDILSKKDALRQDLVYNHNLLSEVNAEVKKEFEQIDIAEDYETNASSISNGSDDEFEENSSPLPATITPTIIEDDDKVLPLADLSPQPAPTSPASAAPPLLFPRIKVAQNLQSKPPRLAPKTTNQKPNIQMPQIQAVHTVAPTLQTNGPTIPTQLQAAISPNSMGKGNAMPFPLLILNGMQSGQNRTNGFSQKTIPINMSSSSPAAAFNSDVCNILKEMLDIQKENLAIEKKRLEVETQKLDYERSVGHQFLSMFSTFQHLIPNDFSASFDTRQNTESESIDTKDFAEHPKFHSEKSAKSAKRPTEEPLSPLRSNKISKETVINGITKYMQECNVPSKESGITVN